MPMKSRSKTITRDPNWLGPAVPPGEILLEEFLKPMQLGQVEAARRLEISLNRMNEIVLGKRGITADTALRLARLLKTSPQFWMRLQADWDLHQAYDRSIYQTRAQSLSRRREYRRKSVWRSHDHKYFSPWCRLPSWFHPA